MKRREFLKGAILSTGAAVIATGGVKVNAAESTSTKNPAQQSRLKPFYIPEKPADLDYSMNDHIHPTYAHDGVVQYTEMLMRMNMAGWLSCNEKQIPMIGAAIKKYPEFCVGVGGLGLNNTDEDLKLIDLYHQNGIKGLGEFKPVKGGIKYTDPKLFPIYEKAQELGMFCFFHTNPDEDEKGNMAPVHVVKIAERYPKLNVIAAHLGNEGYEKFMKSFDSFKEDLSMMRGHKNMYCDWTVFNLFRLGAPYARFSECIREVYTEETDFDHILFGTDFNEIEAIKLRRMIVEDWIEGAGLSRAIKEKIRWKNAHRIIGFPTSAPPKNPFA